MINWGRRKQELGVESCACTSIAGTSGPWASTIGSFLYLVVHDMNRTRRGQEEGWATFRKSLRENPGTEERRPGSRVRGDETTRNRASSAFRGASTRSTVLLVSDIVPRYRGMTGREGCRSSRPHLHVTPLPKTERHCSLVFGRDTRAYGSQARYHDRHHLDTCDYTTRQQTKMVHGTQSCKYQQRRGR